MESRTDKRPDKWRMKPNPKARAQREAWLKRRAAKAKAKA